MAVVLLAVPIVSTVDSKELRAAEVSGGAAISDFVPVGESSRGRILLYLFSLLGAEGVRYCLFSERGVVGNSWHGLGTLFETSSRGRDSTEGRNLLYFTCLLGAEGASSIFFFLTGRGVVG